jgi:hypothetical protein
MSFRYVEEWSYLNQNFSPYLSFNLFHRERLQVYERMYYIPVLHKIEISKNIFL